MQVEAFGAALVDITPGVPLRTDQLEEESVTDRLGYLTAFGRILMYSGGISPYENAAASLVTPVLAILPRDLFAQKVTFFNSGEFAYLLGWPWGGFAVSLPGSFFWAWGYEGILFGMAALGLVLAALTSGGMRGDWRGLLARVVLARLLIELLDVGREFQSEVIGVVRTLTIAALVIFILRRFSVNRLAHNYVTRTGPRRRHQAP
jgi:hypothetical protein